jgi:photosystem II stability/assembly factor-like uncharacterized protein
MFRPTRTLCGQLARNARRQTTYRQFACAVLVGALAAAAPPPANSNAGTARSVAADSPVAPWFVDISPENEERGYLNLFNDCPSTGCVSQQDGGRVNGLAVVADVPNVYFAASEVGGLFKSTDGGSSWTHLDGHLPATAWDVAAAPGGQRVFATSFNEGRTDTSAVLQVSTDGGETWSGRLPAAPDGCAPVRAEQPSAFGIALRPGTSEVLVGTNCGLALSNNAGEVWTRFDPSPKDSRSAVWDIVALPGGRTYACGDDGLLTSPDGQPGEWTSLGTPPLFPGGFCSLAVSPDDPNVVFMAVARGTWPGDAFGVGCCLFPRDGVGPEFYEGDVVASAVAWTRLPYPDADSVNDPAGQVTKKGRVPFVVTNKRSEGYDLWVGDGSLWRVPCSSEQKPNCLPEDRPQWAGSFTDHLGPRTDAHGDSGDLEFNPAMSVDACPTLYSSDGGVYSNTDTLAGTCEDPDFVGANTGLHAFLLWDLEGVHIEGTDTEDIYFATQDNGLYYTDEAGTCNPPAEPCVWDHRTGGDEFDLAADETQVVVSGSNMWVADRGYPNPVQVIRSGLGPLGVPSQVASAGSGEFMMVVQRPYRAVDGSGCCVDKDGNPITIPTGVRDINDVENAPFGSPLGNWTSSKPPCHVVVGVGPNGPQPYVLAGLCYWANSRQGRAFAADDELWTYREVDGVPTWDQIDLPSGATGFGLIAVDPTNSDRLYASVVGGEPPRMVRSTDGGRNWDDDTELTSLMSGNGTFLPYPGIDPLDGNQFTGGLWPYQQPLMVAFDRQNPDILVAGGTSSGVFISSDGGDSWDLLTDPFTPGTSGIPHLPRPLWAHFDHDKPGVVRIYLGTGRGVWRVEVPEADAAIVSFGAVTPPSSVVVGQPVELTLRKVVTNHGPSTPVNITVTRTATAPSGSSVTPEAMSATAIAVAKDELRTIDETFTITCGAPGPQTFSFANQIHPASPAYVDPDATNNSAAAPVTVECVQPVAINIKPGGFPNTINLKGTAPVAVLTTQAGEYGLPLAFDATTIDPASVRFGAASLVFSGTGGAAAIHNAGHVEDSYELDEKTRDGDLDMVLQFRVADSGLTTSSTEACVKGSFAGAGGAVREFFGCDSVKVSP